MILSLSNRGRVSPATKERKKKLLKDMIRKLRQGGNMFHEIKKQRKANRKEEKKI